MTDQRRPARPGIRRNPGGSTQQRAVPRESARNAGRGEDLVRITGLPAVLAVFRSRPDEVERLFFDERRAPQLGEACAALARARRPYRLVEGEELAKIAATVLHGGVLALVRPRPVAAFDPEQAKAWKTPLLLLDGVGNPHNLGAIIRTAAFFGLERLVLSDHPGQAGASEAAYRVAEGGFEAVALFQAANFASQLKRLRASHRVIGTALERGRPLDLASFGAGADPRPVAIVLGNEEDGLPRATIEACEQIGFIPGTGSIQSLNVAATAAILIHALAARPRG